MRLSLAGIAVGSAVALWGLLATDFGLRLAWGWMAARVPGELTATGVRGRLVGPVEVTGLRFENESGATSFDSLWVEWRPTALLRRTVHVDRIDARGVAFHPAPAPEAADPSAPIVDSLPSFQLPTAVRVDSARVVDVRVVDRERETLLDSVRLRGIDLLNEWSAESVVARGPSGSITGSGAVTPRGDWPLSAVVDFAIEPGQAPLVAGELDVEGRLLTGLNVELGTRSPWTTSVSGTVSQPVGRPVVDVRLRVDDGAFADLGEISVPPPEYARSVTVDAGVTGTPPDSLSADFRGSFTGDQIGRVGVEGGVQRAGDDIRLLRVQLATGSGIVVASGTLDLADTVPRFDVDLEWTNVTWPIVGEPVLRSPGGSGSLSGTAEAYRFEGRGTVVGRTGGGEAEPTELSATLVAAGSGGSESVTFSELSVRPIGEGGVPVGTAVARGRAAWAPSPRWDFTFTVDSIDPYRLTGDETLAGRVSARGGTSGRYSGDAVALTMRVDTLTGTLRDDPVEGSLHGSVRLPVVDAGFDWLAANLDLTWLEATWGNAHVFASGVVQDSLRAHWTLSIPDLSTIVPDGAGRLESTGRLRGRRDAPVVTATAFALGVVAGDVVVEEMAASARADAVRAGQVNVEVGGRGVLVGTTAVDSMTAIVDGTSAAHDFSGVVHMPYASVSLGGHGALDGRSWAGVVESGDVTGSALGRWTLEAPTAVLASPDSSSIDEGCLTQAAQRLCGTATTVGETRRMRVVGTSIENRTLVSLARPDLVADGTANLAAELRSESDGSLVGTLDLGFGSGTIEYASAEGPGMLRFSETALRGSIGPDGVETLFGALLIDDRLGPVLRLDGELSLPEITGPPEDLPTAAVVGRVVAVVDDLSVLDALAQESRDLRGSMTADIGISGTVGRPVFVGAAELRDGAFAIAELGFAVDSMQISAQGRGVEGVDLTGSARVGRGTVTGEGWIPVAPSRDRPIEMRLEGESLDLATLPEAAVRAGVAIEVRADPDSIRVGGSVGVERARFDMGEVQDAAVRPSRDVVFVDDTIDSGGALPPVVIDIDVSLGDSTTYRGFGLTSYLRGDFTATSTAGGSVLSTGTISLVDARYRAYGQVLTVDRGRLIYAGVPFSNPGLDVRASRTARDSVVAGVNVAGTLQRPLITLFSEPAMLESDALSYLVLGRPFSAATSLEGARVAEAATALGVRGGTAIASWMGQRVGLDEVRVTAEGPLEEASLEAGKYLSPRLYLSYGVGLFEPISTFRMRYLLSSRWTLSTESGRARGLDLLYRVERGR